MRPFLANATGLGVLVGGSQRQNNPRLGSQVFVGNDSGGDSKDRLEYGTAAGADQIYSLTGVVVASSGNFNLNDRTDSIDSLELTVGRKYSADLNTGDGVIGSLSVTTNIVASSFGTTDGNVPAATIGGTGKLIQLGGYDNFNNHNLVDPVLQGAITVRDTFVPSKNDDLIITASIVDQPVVGGYVAGLREGNVTGNNAAGVNPDTSLQLSPRLGEYIATGNNADGGVPDTGIPWGRNITWIYSGEFYDADGIVSFGADINDGISLRIDGIIPSATYSISNRTVPTMTASSDTSADDIRTTHLLYVGPGNNPTAGLSQQRLAHDRSSRVQRGQRHRRRAEQLPVLDFASRHDRHRGPGSGGGGRSTCCAQLCQPGG